jgi:hypothetical protein
VNKFYSVLFSSVLFYSITLSCVMCTYGEQTKICEMGWVCSLHERDEKT